MLIFCVFGAKFSYADNFKDFNQNVKNYNKKVEIFDENGLKRAVFKAALADNDGKRRYGLMNLRHLKDENGMLFLFEGRAIIHMWMKNTLIPLDMIFIDHDKIVKIYKNARPKSLDIISSGKKVNRVLEINSGLVEKYEISVGDEVRF